ncbi:response regulator [Marinicrinis sediminis]|uniref:Response regulator n=1 Tax=Marinicrinis sediminis TaxID=1652465 RepID=A0ABW5R6F9_9BACL
MRVMIIDDERLALLRMEQLLSGVNKIEGIHSYIHAAEALKEMANLRPDVVLLDIQMPEVSGLDVAAEIKEISADTEVVFVTAYDHYAVEAFRLYALDYLLKPVSMERLNVTMERIRERIAQRLALQPHVALSEVDTPIVICMKCLGSLQLVNARQELIQLKWRTMKIKELFAYLLHCRGQVISRDTLIELLWPEVEEKAGLVNLQTSIYRIRSLLKEHGLQDACVISYVQYGYMLEMNHMALDAEQWEAELTALPIISEHTVEDYQRLFEAYEGDYFGEDGFLWAESERQRLKMMWQHQAHQLAAYYVQEGQPLVALAVYARMVRLDPMLEQAHWAMIRIYVDMNDRRSAVSQFLHMASVLEQEMDAVPDPEMMKWYEDWTSSHRE